LWSDGDNAWICWNKALLDCLPDRSEEPLQETNEKTLEKSNKLTSKRLWDATPDEMLAYAHHFRNHQNHLGQYSKLLDTCIDKDEYGFGHEWAIELGWRAFYQVRHIYSC
jgi:glucose-6-phosphate 1-dehydrogenase